MTSGARFGRRVIHGVTMFPVMVAGIYVIGRLMTDGGDWLGFSLATASIVTVVLILLPGDARAHDPPIEVLYLAVQMTTWWTFGFIFRWSGHGIDWLLYWLVAAAIFAERLTEVHRWEAPPPEH